jgi:hypothetical protein
MNKILLLSLFIFILVLIQGRGSKPKKLKAGSICSVDDGDGKFGIVKILVIDDEIIHVKKYKNKYAEQLVAIDINTLSNGSVYDEAGSGVRHLPTDRKVFDSWKPIIIAFEEVTGDDLEEYEIWKAG